MSTLSRGLGLLVLGLGLGAAAGAQAQLRPELPPVTDVVGSLLRCPPAPVRIVTTAGFEIEFPGPSQGERAGWPDCRGQVIGATAGGGFPTVLDHMAPRRAAGDTFSAPLPLGGGPITTTPYVANITVLANRAGYLFPFHTVGSQSWTVTEASAILLRERPPVASMPARRVTRRPPPIRPTIAVVRHIARSADGSGPATGVPVQVDTWFDLNTGLPMVNCVRNPPSPYTGPARSWKTTAIRPLATNSLWRRTPTMPDRPPAWTAGFDLVEHCRLGRGGEMAIPDALDLELFAGATGR